MICDVNDGFQLGKMCTEESLDVVMMCRVGDL